MKLNFEKLKKNTYFIYTLVFCVVALFLSALFLILNKAIINYTGDGFIQHFSVYVYLSKFYKQLLHQIISFSPISNIDLTIGPGLDILTTLNYYGYGDPFSLIMVFFENHPVLGYSLINILRLYFAGISFIYFINIKSKNSKENHKVIAGIAYAFSGFALMGLRTHLFFINALILLPFILSGIELYKKENKKKVLLISVAISFISNFYFAYMLTLLAVLYECFVIFFEFISKQKSFKEIVIENIKLALWYFVGILLSAIVFLPIVYAFLNNS